MDADYKVSCAKLKSDIWRYSGIKPRRKKNQTMTNGSYMILE
jgi:hypothetical protein